MGFRTRGTGPGWVSGQDRGQISVFGSGFKSWVGVGVVFQDKGQDQGRDQVTWSKSWIGFRPGVEVEFRGQGQGQGWISGSGSGS